MNYLPFNKIYKHQTDDIFTWLMNQVNICSVLSMYITYY